jgi:hypothetical protein
MFYTEHYFEGYETMKDDDEICASRERETNPNNT